MKALKIAVFVGLCAYAVWDLVFVKALPSAVQQLPPAAVQQLPPAAVQQIPPAAVQQLPPAAVQQLLGLNAGNLPYVAPTAAPPAPLPAIPEPTMIPAPANVYAPVYVESEAAVYAPDYGDYTHEEPAVYAEWYVDEFYAGKTYTTADGHLMSLEDAEFLLACVDGKLAGRRVSPKCPSDAAEILGTGR